MSENENPRADTKEQNRNVSRSRLIRIRRLNDALRSQGSGGIILMTYGVAAYSTGEVEALFKTIAAYEAFDESNDPYGEHDLGIVPLGTERALWKIDYFDRSRRLHSPDPSDPKVTVRVMTVMLLSEY